MSVSRSRTAALALAVLALAIAPSARAITIQTISGVFSNTLGGSNQSFPADVAVPGWGTGLENQARWGTGQVPGVNSGLGFTPNVPGLVVPLEQEFVIGRVRHFNNPILSPALSTQLTITLEIAEATPGSSSFPYTFVIDETDNLEPCLHPGSTICPDRIDNTDSHSGVVFQIGPQTFTLSILGWRAPTPDGPFSSLFVSEEGGTSQAFLVGKITSNLAPEPGTALLLGIGLTGLAAGRRRR